MKITNGIWKGLPVTTLQSDEYEAMILNSFGANCVSLIHRSTGTQLLRVPGQARELYSNPNVYGMPLLFPANRIWQGHYTFEGREYYLPVNEPTRDCHIHGTLSSTTFTHDGSGRFEFAATVKTPYLAFPHAFQVVRGYQLDEKGLDVSITVTNNSPENMPCGVGMHTALNALSDESTIQIPVLREWPYDPDTIMPTCETREDSPRLTALRNGTQRTSGERISNMLELNPGPVRMRAPQGTIVQETDDFRFLMLWNATGDQGFICPEPQNWLINTPNLPIPAEASGFTVLAPDTARTWRVRYSFEPA